MRAKNNDNTMRACSRARRSAFSQPPTLNSELSTLNSKLKALTLIEVLVVLVLMGIALSLAVVSIRDWSVHSKLDGAAKQIVQALRFAQGQAMVTGDDAAVEFDANAETLRCVRSVGDPPYANLNDPLTKRPYAIDLVASAQAGVNISSVNFDGDATVTFNKDGAPSEGGTVVLQYGQMSRTITITPVSGKIVVQ